MKQILTILVVLLFSTSVMSAQDVQVASSSSSGSDPSGSNSGSDREQGDKNRDDDDDDDDDERSPLQIGYAIITPVGVTTSGLVVSETFGLKWGFDFLHAGVLPPDLTTNGLLFVDANGRLSKNIGVAIVNPNSSDVNVTLTLRGENGSTLGATVVNVPSHHQVAKFVTEMFATNSAVPKDITGTLQMTSVSPIAVVGLRFRGIHFSTIPATNLAIAGPVPSYGTGIGGLGAILLPQFAAGGGWKTEIVLSNTGTTSLTVRLDLFKSDGTALTATMNGKTASSFTDLVIPAGGVLVLKRHKDD